MKSEYYVNVLTILNEFFIGGMSKIMKSESYKKGFFKDFCQNEGKSEWLKI